MYNNKIKSLTITKNITRIEDYAFAHCKSLRTVKFETVRFTCYQNVFKGCDISKVEFPQNMKTVPCDLFYNAQFHSGTEIVLPQSVEEVEEGAFRYTKNLKSVKFTGNNLVKIGRVAFEESSISNIEFPESLKYIGDYTFDHCNNISSIVIPKNVEYIGSYAFTGCNNLSSVIIKTNKIPLENGCGHDIFRYCQISKLELPDSWTYIPNNLFDNAGFKSGTVVVIPSSVKRIGKYAFNDSNLEKIKFAGNKLKSVGEMAFAGSKLATITFPESLESLEFGAFSRNEYLHEINLPSNLKSIGYMCFAN